jgi:hypothetical protein
MVTSAGSVHFAALVPLLRHKPASLMNGPFGTGSLVWD